MEQMTSAKAVLLSLLVLFTLFHAVTFEWISDDALISFRYLKNYLAGKDLVFNSGERVEGYTNYLWIMVLAPLVKIGADVFDLSFGLSQLCNVLTLVLCFLLATRLFTGWYALVPPSLLAAQGVFAAWPRTGLETSFFTFEIMLGIFLAVRELEGRFGIKQPFPASLVFGLAALTRPEGLLFFLFYLGFLVWQRHRNRFSSAPNYISWHIVIFFSIFLGFLTWRYSFYGELTPNTASKVALISVRQWMHGLYYLLGYAQTFGGIALYLIAGIGLIAVLLGEKRPKAPVFYYLLVNLVLWLAYVAYVGGDFMPFFRFITPILPVAALMLTFCLNRIFGMLKNCPKENHSLSLLEVAFFGILFLTFLNASIVGRQAKFSDDEAGEERFRKAVGLWLKQNAAPQDVIALNAIGYVSYYSELRAIDMLGLTDRHISREGHRDKSLPAGHQMGDGKYVLSHRPRFIFPLTLKADNYFQKEKPPVYPYTDLDKYMDDELKKAHQWRIPWSREIKSIHAKQHKPFYRVFVSTRELLLDPEFNRLYRLREYPLSDREFKHFRVFERISP